MSVIATCVKSRLWYSEALNFAEPKATEVIKLPSSLLPSPVAVWCNAGLFKEGLIFCLAGMGPASGANNFSIEMSWLPRPG